MNQLKIGAILSYVSLGLSNIIGLLYTPFMLSMMGQSEYGLYSLVASIVAYLTILDGGFGNAIVRYTAKFRSEGRIEEQYSVFGMFVILYSIIGILAFLIGLLLYFNINTLFGSTMTMDELDKAQIMMLLLIFNISITFPLSIFGSIITAYENFIFQQVVNIVRVVINPLAMVVLLFMGYKAIGLVVITTLLNIVTLLINWWYCKRKLKIKIRFGQYNWPLLKEITLFSMFVFLKLILDKVYWSSGQFIIGSYIGTVAVAIYSVAILLKTYYGSFTYILTPLFLPKLTRMVACNNPMPAISDLFLRVGRYQFILASLVLAGFILFGRDFLLLWAGPEYLEAYYMTLIIIIPQTIPLIQTLGQPLFQAQNKQKYQTYIYALAAILSLSLSIPLTVKYGGIGCAIGIAIPVLLCEGFIMNYYYYKIGIDVLGFWSKIIRIAFPVFILFILGLIINMCLTEVSVFILFSKILLFTIAFFLLFYFRLSTLEERILLKSLMNKIKKI